MSKKSKPRTWAVELRSYTCCRGCDTPGECASRAGCAHGYTEEGRVLMAPLEFAQHGAAGIAAALMAPLESDKGVAE